MGPIFFWVLVLENAFSLASCLVDSLAGTLGSKIKLAVVSTNTSHHLHSVITIIFLLCRKAYFSFQQILFELISKGLFG